MKHLSLLLLAFGLSFQFSFAQEKVADTATIKLKLTEYLLSCQTMTYTIIEESDSKMKFNLAEKGLDYCQKAQSQFALLQTISETEIDEAVKKGVPILLNGYEQIFVDISKLNNPAIVVGLAHMETMYKKGILSGLWK
ncbi:MAG: hypothetical protein K9G46_03915 [Flavobacteriales bacterium]|jgi:hypothetical protein|nr:hypothetical protein [Flavobacteriales bacterium]